MNSWSLLRVMRGRLFQWFCPGTAKGYEKARNPVERCFGQSCCGGRTRTCDLQVMSLASYQLLHSAMFLICGCKGTAFRRTVQVFCPFFFSFYMLKWFGGLF